MAITPITPKKLFDKNHTVAKLLSQTYDGENTFDRLMVYETNIEIIFANKPEQSVIIFFAGFDTWNRIKSKVEKLMSSDGVCVVCCETEKGKKKTVRKHCCDDPHCRGSIGVEIVPSGVCQSCCEYLCRTCYLSMQGGMKCPVCRECFWSYTHKIEEVVQKNDRKLRVNCIECTPSESDESDDE